MVMRLAGKTTSLQVQVSLHSALETFKVQMTVPADHVVGGTGSLSELCAGFITYADARWTKAQNAAEPVQIVTLDEALNASKVKSNSQNKNMDLQSR
jgi:hypothetical protein